MRCLASEKFSLFHLWVALVQECALKEDWWHCCFWLFLCFLRPKNCYFSVRCAAMPVLENSAELAWRFWEESQLLAVLFLLESSRELSYYDPVTCLCFQEFDSLARLWFSSISLWLAQAVYRYYSIFFCLNRCCCLSACLLTCLS
jgi:hypothetical protein